MKHLNLLFFIIVSVIIIGCQQKKPLQISATYLEPLDPAPNSLENWNVIENGLHASIVPISKRFVKSDLPKIPIEKNWTTNVWKGERASLQLALWSKDSITKVVAEISDFKSETGEKLPSSIAQSRFVKYVITDEFAQGCGYRKPEDFKASLVADALDTVSSYAVKQFETRPLWITINIPENATQGTYVSTLKLLIEGQKTQSFTLSFNVLPKTLPPPTAWKFHLDLWQNPYAVARYHQVEPWSKKHWELLTPLMKELADAGQKVITVSLNKRPWGGQTFDPFDSMIKWKKKVDGTWEYDFTIFDNWVEFMMNLGIKNQISCYSMVPWGNEFYYFDETTNQELKVKAPPGSKEYEQLWIPFLTKFKVHLKTKGWNTITRMAMDERKPDEMKAMFNLLNTYAPEFGASFADNHKSYKLYPNQLKDLSVAFGATIDEEDLQLRKQNGYISTHYVCCSDKFPNVFTFSDPSEGVFIGWYSIAAGFDGFLRWAYNSWVENPLQDSRFRTWPAGDTYLVYPDARSSIRFETLREGIEDAEKIRILRQYLSENNKIEELKELNKMVEKFNITTKPPHLDHLILEGKSTLTRLSKL
ncbi:glycoside hydrolase domain-containing protein [Lutibacter aestuarii]|uniref:Glycoside hydrolase domain-containing protein n=1 Tax=Lutibacter aestuarii TaxID=861111 RepID=A0ABW2Z7D7_9FLAO